MQVIRFGSVVFTPTFALKNKKRKNAARVANIRRKIDEQRGAQPNEIAIEIITASVGETEDTSSLVWGEPYLFDRGILCQISLDTSYWMHPPCPPCSMYEEHFFTALGLKSQAQERRPYHRAISHCIHVVLCGDNIS